MVAVSSIASQIYVNMFVDGFIIALSVVMMGIFLYIFRDLNAIVCCCLIAVFSPLVRLLIMIWQGGEYLFSAKLVLPDMAFFLAYAALFGVIFRFLGYSTYGRYYVRLALSDFLSNCMEMMVRILVFQQYFTSRQLLGLITLALLRSFLILLVCISSDLYRSLLEKAEHEANYKKLVLMAATFNSEVYFMEKNMNEIEEIMKNAFTLYRSLGEDQYPQELQTLALEISKDIHEVKKGYRRVIKGLKDNFLSEFQGTSLSLHDIMKILTVEVEKSAGMRDIDVAFHWQYETNYIIEKHFSLMSILRNLVGNSLDAIEASGQGRGNITLRFRDVKDGEQVFCIAEIKDDGPGIEQSMIDVLFEPGFSTKYNEETGDINRGLGLTLVRDLLWDKFQGEIQVTSFEKKNTVFTLRIPAEQLGTVHTGEIPQDETLMQGFDRIM